MNKKTTVKQHIRKSKSGKRSPVRRHSRNTNSSIKRSSPSGGFVIEIHKEYDENEILDTFDQFVNHVRIKSGLTIFGLKYKDQSPGVFEGIVLAKNLSMAQKVIRDKNQIAVPMPRDAKTLKELLERYD